MTEVSTRTAGEPAVDPGNGQETPRRDLRETLSLIADRSGALWTFGVLIIIVLAFVLTTPAYWSKGAWLATSLSATPILLIAVGQTFVIVSRGVDLSVGAVLGFSAMVGGWVMTQFGSGTSATVVIVLGLLAAMAVGLILGLINGIVITKLEISPLVATLGMLGVASGGTQLVNGGQELAGFPHQLTELGNKVLLDGWIALPVLVAGVVALLGGVALANTRFGRHTYASGSSPEAARRTGVNVDRHLIKVYGLSGFMAGLAGFLVMSQLGAASITAGQGAELESIVAVVIGGASLFGGRGTVAGSVIGTFIVAVIETGLVVAKVAAAWQLVAVGAILIAAVYMDRQRLRLARHTH
ncbi:MAG TPA: ABC transporter permease [Solirubrobacterales bacterium]